MSIKLVRIFLLSLALNSIAVNPIFSSSVHSSEVDQDIAECGRNFATTMNEIDPEIAKQVAQSWIEVLLENPKFAAGVQQQVYASRPKKTIKILSCDGGGMRGIGSLEVLRELEAQMGKPCYDVFDYFAGVSTGSIIAGGLAMGKTAEQLSPFYRDDGKSIFQTSWLYKLSTLGGLGGPYYDGDKLEDMLRGEIGDLKLADVFKDQQKSLLIPSFDLNSKKPIFFTNDQDNTSVDLATAMRASCSAPVYFPPTVLDGYSLADGGLIVNNPAEMALREAQRLYPPTAEQYVQYLVFSVGTGSTKAPLQVSTGGIYNWGTQLIDVLTTAPAKGVHTQLKRNAGAPVHYYRADFTLPKKIDLAATDDASLDLITKAAQQLATKKVVTQFCEDVSAIEQSRPPACTYMKGDKVKLAALQQSVADFEIPLKHVHTDVGMFTVIEDYGDLSDKQ